MKSPNSFEIKVLVAFIAAVLVVAGLATSIWKLAQDAAEASRWLAHSHEVRESISGTKTETLQIEFSTQAYRVTGDLARLAERDASIAMRESMMEKIRQLTADNPRQQARWVQLREVLNQRLAISRQVEMLRRTQGADAANAFVATAPLQSTRARTFALLREMDEEERLLLDKRNADQLSSHQVMVSTGAWVALLLLALLFATYVLLSRQLGETAASQRALTDSEESLATTLHAIGDAVLATDTQGRITRMNPSAELLTGWSVAQALGRPVEEVFCTLNEQTRLPNVGPVAQVIETGQPQALANKSVIVSRDGHECPIADSAAPIRDTKGNLTGVVLVFRDEAVARQAQRSTHEKNELLEQHVAERTRQLRESEDHLLRVINNVPALIAYVDAKQRYVYVNRQYRERFAPERSDIKGCSVSEILGPDRYAVASPLIDKVLQGQPQSYDWQPFPGVWQVITYIPRRDAQHQLLGYYVLGSDITERKHTEEKIQTLNVELQFRVRELEYTSRALRTLSAGNRAMLRANDEQDLLDSMCQAIVGAGGYPAAMVWYCDRDGAKLLQPMAECGYPAGLDSLRQLTLTWAGSSSHGRGVVANAIGTGQASVVLNMRSNPSDESLRPPYLESASCIACPLHVEGEVVGALVVCRAETQPIGSDEIMFLSDSADDLAFGIATLRARSEQQKIQQEILHLTRFDVLTGLPNQAQFTEQMTAAIEAGKRLGQPFAVLQTNIERLGEINVALGFGSGDQMLCEFALRLRQAAPQSAMVARLRGDEFAVLLTGAGASDAIALIRRLERVLVAPFPIADISLDVSVRVGVVVFPEHGSTLHDLYRHMDVATNLAKKQGVTHVVFDPAREHNQAHHLSLAGELRRAIEHGDLQLYLQPKVHMATGQVCGAEGLVRWMHAERGLIPPSEFIGLAEHTGLIKPLTEWVIETSLRLNHDWAQEGCALPIAVNLSARNLRDENLLEKIRQLRATWGTAASLLELEITESSVMDDPAFALRVLHSLQEEGISLYIDDFGTGYSSLSYLQKLPVEYIKIDQSFVGDMSVSKDSALIVQSTIDLVHGLGRQTVAEGVETQQHWHQLVSMGCDIAQGYFIARPMPPQDFQAWVAQYRPPARFAF